MPEHDEELPATSGVPPIPPAAPIDDWWVDDAASTAAPTSPTAATDAPTGATTASSKGPAIRWIAAGVTALVIGGGAAYALTRSGSHTSPAAAAAAGTPATGQGPNGGRRGPGTFGTIAAIKGTSFTVTTANGATVNVTTSRATTITTSQTGALADVKVGDRITAIGTGTTAAVTADRVVDTGTLDVGFGNGRGGNRPPTGVAPNPGAGGAPGGPGGGQAPDPNAAFAAGTVTKVDGVTIDVTTADGTTATVTTSAATRFTITRPASFGALTVGEQVQVSGEAGADGTVAAARIQVGEGIVGLPGGRRGGSETTPTTTS
jgi:hypothetical protein